MYQAIVVACLIGSNILQKEQCTSLEAQKWQGTESACQSHALFLAEKVHIYMKGYKPVSWSCKALPKGVLSK
tara:strand:+ start:6121 stop:6336 length:216 start_codon:yes stop_codon:yes gene_type:complete